MKYEEIVEYILSIPKFTKKNTMEDTRAFYEFLECPGEQKKIIHVAGTNGKGSVCAFLNQIFVEGGYSVGMFTSPHLIYIEERFQVNGKQMSTDIFEKIFLLLQKGLKEYQKDKPEYHPTFFEFLFFMGMLFFKDENVDYIILETGLGGRLDATNVVRNPEICVITKIGLDHTEYLGNTLREVAFEKAGIIKEGKPVLVWNENEEVADVIRNQASKKNADIYFADFSDAIGVKNRNKKIDFYYNSSYYRDMHCKINSVADYQVYNALLAIKVCEILSSQIKLTKENIRIGLLNTIWPGRMEEIEPGIFLDGAHNLDGIKALLQGSSFKRKEKSILLFSVVREKNYEQMISALAKSGEFSEICITSIPGTRGVDMVDLANEFRKYVLDSNVNIVIKEEIKEAYQYCKDRRSNDGMGDSQNLYVIGSLYLIGAIKELKLKNGNN